MNTPKRGLGRGLEALLVDIHHKETEEQFNSTALLVKVIQTENANLIREAENLKALLDDFETMVREFKVE